MNLPVEQLSSMTPEQERQFWEQFERDLDSDTGEAAQEHFTRPDTQSTMGIQPIRATS